MAAKKPRVEKQAEPTTAEVVEDGAVLEPDGAMTLSTVAMPLSEGMSVTGSVVKPTIPCGIFKLNSEAQTPEYATAGSMCFDLSAAIVDGDVITVYSAHNIKGSVKAYRSAGSNKFGVVVDPGCRALIPSGLVFDLQEGTALLLYPRSGMSLKQDAKLGNCIGVVDSDYIEQTYAIIKNDSQVPLTIQSGDKICQGEVVIAPPQASFNELQERPKQKTSRNGGFGSTGK